MNNKKPLIIAIDDTPSHLGLLKAALSPDFEVTTVTSGAEGLALAIQSPPDLILLDILMPDMDGFETCRRIQAVPSLKEVPIVFVTVSAESDAEMEGLSLGGADYITKPINVRIARQRVYNLLEREQLRKNVERQRNELDAEIAERKITEAKRRETEERFSLAQRASHSGAWDWNLCSGEMVWSEELFNLFGLAHEEVGACMETWVGLLHPDDRSAAELALQKSIQEHLPFSKEYRIIRPLGEVRWVQGFGNASYDQQGNPVRIAGICVDITERRRTEIELTVLRTEMQQILEWQVIRHTVAGLAHEINQPLSSISVLCEAAKRMIEIDSSSLTGASAYSERLKQTVQQMAAESERAGGVVRNLLDSLHKPSTTLETVGLETILDDTKHLAQSGGYADLNIVIECEPNPSLVHVNRVQVDKVLLNLICNSAEAMASINKHHGTIWISSNITDSGNDVCVTVRDEGPGVREDVLTQIFHPFVTTKTTGTGLGLAISRTLIEAHGGKLWHEPTEKPGACFRFTLPLSR